MLTTPKIYLRCCPQHRKIMDVVGNNADHIPALLPSTLKGTLISIHVFFSALLPIQQKNYRRC
jgi:hypothetical protein